MLAGWCLLTLHDWDAAPAWVSVSVSIYFKVFGTTRNGMYLGFFYVALGMVAGLRSEMLSKLSSAVVILLLALGMAGCLLVTPDQHLPFCALAAFGVFALSTRSVRSGNRFSLARNTSTIIYLTHMLFIVFFVYIVFEGSGPSIYSSGAPMGAVFILTIACASAFAALVIPLSGRFRRLAEIFGI